MLGVEILREDLAKKVMPSAIGRPIHSGRWGVRSAGASVTNTLHHTKFLLGKASRFKLSPIDIPGVGPLDPFEYDRVAAHRLERANRRANASGHDALLMHDTLRVIPMQRDGSQSNGQQLSGALLWCSWGSSG